MNKTTISVVIVLAVIILGAWYWYSGPMAESRKAAQEEALFGPPPAPVRNQ